MASHCSTLAWKIPWAEEPGRLPSMGSKEFDSNVGDLGSIPRLGRSPGEGKGYPLQYYGLENSMDYIDHGVAKSQTRLSYFHFHFIFSVYSFSASFPL